jgi:hypothetical protein
VSISRHYSRHAQFHLRPPSREGIQQLDNHAQWKIL